MIKLDDVVAKILAYNTKADVDLIKKAYAFCSKAHAGQQRRSGQPFVIHPLEVAAILADMKLDTPSIVAGILHDVIEDTPKSKEDVAQLFGAPIAELVDGVTKLSKLKFNTREERQAETIRKMILAMSKDIRAILIKLADRLHNMQTLQFMPEDRQRVISQETLDIYAPIANRLGIQWMKDLLEDLSFRFLKPDIYRQIEKKISRLRKNREEYIERVVKEIRKHFGESIPKYEIGGRLKHVYGIYRKMERQNISFEQIHDLIAFRILTPSVEECYEALGLLHSIWKPVPGRFKDYIAMPKPNNYQSLHSTVICLDGERAEFQIRSYGMHEVSDKGIAAHWKYKEDGEIDLEAEKTFQWLRQLVEWQKEVQDSFEFMDTVKLDLFTSEIYIFTPKGDVKMLPHGATPIDFAYGIHSDIGDHCSGAKVNGRIVPLSYQLQSGDVLQILTHPQRHPTKDWLKIAGSSRARAKIRQYLKNEQREKSVSMGKGIFEEECSKFGVKPDDVVSSRGFTDAIREKGLQEEESLYSAVAYGKISVPTLLAHLYPDKKGDVEPREEGFIRKIFNKVSQRHKGMILVDGLDDILVTFGRCCSAVCGDPIVGFITRGRGVTVHRVECPKVPSIDPERRVRVSWNAQSDLSRTAKLRILCESRAGMLAAITQAIADKKVNITKAIVRTTRDEKAIILLDVAVTDVNELHAVMKGVEKITGVIAAQRQVE